LSGGRRKAVSQIMTKIMKAGVIAGMVMAYFAQSACAFRVPVLPSQLRQRSVALSCGICTKSSFLATLTPLGAYSKIMVLPYGMCDH